MMNEMTIKDVHKSVNLRDIVLKMKKIQDEIDLTYVVAKECIDADHCLTLYQAVERINSLEIEKEEILSSLDSKRKDIILKLLL